MEYMQSSRYLQNPLLQQFGPTGVVVNDAQATNRGAFMQPSMGQAAGDFNYGLNTNVSGKISLGLLAAMIIGLALFAFWTRGYQL